VIKMIEVDEAGIPFPSRIVAMLRKELPDGWNFILIIRDQDGVGLLTSSLKDQWGVMKLIVDILETSQKGAN